MTFIDFLDFPFYIKIQEKIEVWYETKHICYEKKFGQDQDLLWENTCQNVTRLQY